MLRARPRRLKSICCSSSSNASRANEGPDRWHWRPGPSFVAHTIHPSSRAFSFAACQARARSSWSSVWVLQRRTS